jgi:putative Holliday junction resolvase
MHDERLTTVEADEVMTEMGVKREDFKKYVDKIAATIILQEWLDNHGSDEICNG